jgi:hypothetical protein
VSAGWTIISGSGTANVLLESATTPNPQNLVCRVQLQDTGSGQCAQIRFRNQGNTKAQANQMFLYTTTGKVYRVIANKYQFFCFSSDSMTVGRTFVAGGVPYLPSFLQGVIYEAIWCHGNSINSDTDATLRASFRTGSYVGYSNSEANDWQVVNGNSWETYGTYNGDYPGHQVLITQMGAKQSYYNSWQPPVYRWHDGSVLTFEPLIAWGISNSTEPMIRGQLWDAALVTGQYVADQTTTFDSNNWWVLTNNANWSYGGEISSTMMLVIP